MECDAAVHRRCNGGVSGVGALCQSCKQPYCRPCDRRSSDDPRRRDAAAELPADAIGSSAVHADDWLLGAANLLSHSLRHRASADSLPHEGAVLRVQKAAAHCGVHLLRDYGAFRAKLAGGGSDLHNHRSRDLPGLGAAGKRKMVWRAVCTEIQG